MITTENTTDLPQKSGKNTLGPTAKRARSPGFLAEVGVTNVKSPYLSPTLPL